jgi:hypothetical protein
MPITVRRPRQRGPDPIVDVKVRRSPREINQTERCATVCRGPYHNRAWSNEQECLYLCSGTLIPPRRARDAASPRGHGFMASLLQLGTGPRRCTAGLGVASPRSATQSIATNSATEGHLRGPKRPHKSLEGRRPGRRGVVRGGTRGFAATLVALLTIVWARRSPAFPSYLRSTLIKGSSSAGLGDCVGDDLIPLKRVWCSLHLPTVRRSETRLGACYGCIPLTLGSGWRRAVMLGARLIIGLLIRV